MQKAPSLFFCYTFDSPSTQSKSDCETSMLDTTSLNYCSKQNLFRTKFSFQGQCVLIALRMGRPSQVTMATIVLRYLTTS